jgi:hypothetical protein
VQRVSWWASRLEVGGDAHLVERFDEIRGGIPSRSALTFVSPSAASAGVEMSWDLAVMQRESANGAGQQLDCGEIESSLHYTQVNAI